MTKIKLCGLTRESDIAAANRLKPELIGFLFAKNSRRYVRPDRAKALRALLEPEIKAVGVFVNEPPERVAHLLAQGIIDIAQLHGTEDEAYMAELRRLTSKPIMKAFRIGKASDVVRAENSSADLVLLDSGGGTGSAFDWSLLKEIKRPYFLAGGLNPENVGAAIETLHPYGVDVSSGIETDGRKDEDKMARFVANVRKEETP